ncbi:MAG: AzlC family ABC transporter permease [Peptoniphilaceae bacterium]|uniref:AzlC family ABC transporter permease n=1 Tax=Parvimonas sp. TaxID=1944660 RepID=UPI0025E66691|nr:AzlC family ABC transporter permease [Parvimonas sp.]MCI5996728.1 AzlC family ABC transporter permease [Parvimonas sp.]MDD7764527.1 AzlC family ABC transporter permease [Peptoniphilaceae bacterium]MDY3050455.1 AzlC family ABC transporter permease [Parvimonas sp.]
MKEKLKLGYTLGARKSIPILIGYIPVALTFGILCRTKGLKLIHVILSSFVLYSGAAQFMLIDFMLSFVPIMGIAISVFLLNSRLFLMSATVGATINKLNHLAFPIIGWLLTDESFSIISFNKDDINTRFTLGVQIPPYFIWGIFSVIGFFIGDLLPNDIEMSLGLGLLGLFVALLVPNVKKNKSTIKVVILTAFIYATISYSKIFPMGWDIVISIIISSIVGIFMIDDDEIED